MENVKIIGLGMVNRLGGDIDNIWYSLSELNEALFRSEKAEYQSIVPSKKRRRMNRYSDMAVYSAGNAIRDAKLDIENIDPFKIGTIYSTGYGPLSSNLEFTDMLLKGDPDLCSPTVFANTVSNACIGHICMYLGLKGVSTIVMGSNSIGYSQMLLNKGDADYILTGAIEEYNPDLYASFKRNNLSQNVDISEAAVSLVLTSKVVNNNYYCDLVDFAEINIGKYPLVNQNTEKSKEQIKYILSKFLTKYPAETIDCVFNANNNSYFDNIENEVLENFFDKETIITKLKEFAGETLGSSLSLTIGVAALCLQKGKIPKNLAGISNKSGINRILVTGYDVTGNYILYLLQK